MEKVFEEAKEKRRKGQVKGSKLINMLCVDGGGVKVGNFKAPLCAHLNEMSISGIAVGTDAD